MKLFSAIKIATFRSLKTWKGVLIVWFSSLLLVSMLAVPMKGVLKSGIGNSMITEKLANGIDLEVFADMSATTRSLTSFFSSGFLLVILVSLLMNAFYTGGLFNSLKGSSVKFSAGEFFQAGAKNFWSFLVITLILSIIILILAVVIIGIPVSIVSQASVPVEGAQFKAVRFGLVLFILALAIFVLVADYARAWQVANDKSACFKAIGFGFSQTFKTFLSSYPLMIILLITQFLFGWLVVKILPGMSPVTGGGVFHLFLLSQFLFVIRILLKVWRYGCVTALMEENGTRLIQPDHETITDQFNSLNDIK